MKQTPLGFWTKLNLVFFLTMLKNWANKNKSACLCNKIIHPKIMARFLFRKIRAKQDETKMNSPKDRFYKNSHFIVIFLMINIDVQPSRKIKKLITTCILKKKSINNHNIIIEKICNNFLHSKLAKVEYVICSKYI